MVAAEGAARLLDPPPQTTGVTIVVGLSAFGRSAAVLVENGEFRAGVCEEQFSRQKNDPSMPRQAFRWCCDSVAVAPHDVSYVVLAEKPVQHALRVVDQLAGGFPGTFRAFSVAMQSWLGKRLWLKSSVRRACGVSAERVLFVERNVAQVTSALLTSRFESAAVLVLDGEGEWAATTLAHGARDADGHVSLDTFAKIRQPHDLTAILHAVASLVRIPVTGGLRRLSTLAARGRPVYLEELRRIVKTEPDGAYSVDLRYLDLGGPRAVFSRRGRALLGELELQGSWDSEAPPEAAADLARSAQEVVIERCLALANEAKRRTNADQLCLGGSLFFDPRIAARLVQEAPFECVHVDPFLGDAGAANGAALFVSHVSLGRPQDATLPLVLSELPSFAVAEFDVQPRDEDSLIDSAAELLAGGAVVGWIQDAGLPTTAPRAQRAILTDLGSSRGMAALRDVVKGLPAWVPFAVAMPADLLTTWAGRCMADAARSAQIAIPVPAALSEVYPQLPYVDGTMLVQAVDQDQNPRLARVLDALRHRTGRFPVLAMTSFNRTGEPSVLSDEDAAEFLLDGGIDALFWGLDEVRV